MQKIRSISISEYQYELPDERIAKFPLFNRDSSKLLFYKNRQISEYQFAELPSLLPENSLMVFNNTRVIQARLHFYTESGAKIEVFCLEPDVPAEYVQSFQSTTGCSWVCMVGNSKKWKEGKLTLRLDALSLNFSAERLTSEGQSQVVKFSWDNDSLTFAQILEHVGELPIPPYLNRDTEEADKLSYQTLYSKMDGSVAAPTAGLHFTERVFDELERRQVECRELTLHVGAGTFKPVKSAQIGEHEMHTEFISVGRELIERLLAGKTVIAVGTTSVRTLESLYYVGNIIHRHPSATPDDLRVTQWMPYNREYTLTVEESLTEILSYLNLNALQNLTTSTQIMIAPGYQFRIVRGIVTNFHQPSSTLLLLVSAFVGGDWQSIYDYALSHDFRFLSYGDSSLLLRE